MKENQNSRKAHIRSFIIILFLIKKKDLNGTKDVNFIKKMEIPFDNLLERCNLSFEDKLKLVGGSIYYVSDE